jgi:uncharacterized protein (UPF0335 family)
MTANAQLQSFIDRIEKLQAEKEAISDDIREVKAEAKSSGFDLPTINRLLKLRKLSDQERREQEQLLEAYEASLGALKDTPLGDAAMERVTTKVRVVIGPTQSGNERMVNAVAASLAEEAKRDDGFADTAPETKRAIGEAVGKRELRARAVANDNAKPGPSYWWTRDNDPA